MQTNLQKHACLENICHNTYLFCKTDTLPSTADTLYASCHRASINKSCEYRLVTLTQLLGRVTQNERCRCAVECLL